MANLLCIHESENSREPYRAMDSIIFRFAASQSNPSIQCSCIVIACQRSWMFFFHLPNEFLAVEVIFSATPPLILTNTTLFSSELNAPRANRGEAYHR